ncbi:hypothetical protein MKW98_019667 [Papaver atlanticum]|uniref:Uncharacterized protein n=1 Tax=Papaver atlanticum TaxID=357466 RepID=A0AAD4S999_9MAGN|nr:hypothetical protein MKW98_019667 [Papaver atlanticum]
MSISFTKQCLRLLLPISQTTFRVIYQIIIQGFKSYREQIEPKNSVLKLIALVMAFILLLSNHFQNLGNDDRHALLHVKELRNKVSETSAKMHNDVLDTHENAKKLENEAKDLLKKFLV